MSIYAALAAFILFRALFPEDTEWMRSLLFAALVGLAWDELVSPLSRLEGPR